MRYFVVFQNQSYKEERQGGYLWAPKINKDGKTFFHWTNMTKVEKGDIIFSSYKRKLVAIGVAKENFKEQEKPYDLDENNLWEKDGWVVNVDYYDLNNPINFNDHIENILSLQNHKYAPFNAKGKGNVGYLFEVGSELANYLLEISKNNQIDINIKEKVTEVKEKSEEDIIKNIENSLPETLDNTEKQRITKSRVGQGIFRKKLELFDCKCKICGLQNKSLLIASHIKPWKASNNKERLDVYNGFLLCPSHDALFDKRYITFDDEGNIIISDKLSEKTKELMNIHKDIKINLKDEHKVYVKYHRKKFYENI